ncbi:MAG: CBS domain-containing protein [Vicingaceae bacterium]
MKFVNNYRGKRAETSTAEISSIKVSDYMATKLITFSPDQLMHEVVETLLKNRISGAPVVNDKNELIGIISEGDCLKLISESQYHNMPLSEGKVEAYMATDVKTIDGNMSIFDAASKFLSSRIRRFPVLEEGKLVGQISQKDIMKAVLDLDGVDWKKNG